MNIQPAVSGRERNASHEARIADGQYSQRRLQHLYDISKVLTRFPTFEETVPEVIALMAQSLPLRSAILILEESAAPRSISWQVEGQSARQLHVAKAHAQKAYSYLVHSRVDFEEEAARTLPTSRHMSAFDDAEPGLNDNFVLLPCVVDRGAIFGALQIEGARALSEVDLYFVNSVVNLLAVALKRHLADKALRASEERLAGIIAIAADALISIDQNQTIVMYNEGAEKIFGWSREEVLGQSYDILVPMRFREPHRQHVTEFAAGHGMARKMADSRPGIFGLRKNGQEFPAEEAISKLNVGTGWLFTLFLRDITEQKRVDHEEQFLAAVGAILATTLDTRQLLHNIARVALAEFGDFCAIEFVDERGDLRRISVTTSDPAKKQFAEALQNFPVDRTRPHMSSSIVLTKQSRVTAEVTPELIASIAQSPEHRRLIDAIAPTTMMGVPLLVRDRLLGTLMVASCHVGMHFSGNDLRLLEQLGWRAALALENARLYRSAQGALQARDEVLGIVAHDLRTPLATILGQALLLRRSGVDAASIERAARRMERLIRDLLDVSSIEAGHLSISFARVTAGQLVTDSVEAQKRIAPLANLEFKSELAPDLPDLWADRDRLLQVLENLIGNAVKFTAPSGQITVGARRENRDLLFWVTDSGVGISTEQLPHVFDRFWQARSHDRRGAGLGLAIVKSIVKAHGGRIWVESVLGTGSTFSFTIPLAPSLAS
ncbi:MAG: ATP-binding protein [Pseudomonadota bacterium]